MNSSITVNDINAIIGCLYRYQGTAARELGDRRQAEVR